MGGGGAIILLVVIIVAFVFISYFSSMATGWVISHIFTVNAPSFLEEMDGLKSNTYLITKAINDHPIVISMFIILITTIGVGIYAIFPFIFDITEGKQVLFIPLTALRKWCLYGCIGYVSLIIAILLIDTGKGYRPGGGNDWLVIFFANAFVYGVAIPVGLFLAHPPTVVGLWAVIRNSNPEKIIREFKGTMKEKRDDLAGSQPRVEIMPRDESVTTPGFAFTSATDALRTAGNSYFAKVSHRAQKRVLEAYVEAATAAKAAYEAQADLTVTKERTKAQAEDAPTIAATDRAVRAADLQEAQMRVDETAHKKGVREIERETEKLHAQLDAKKAREALAQAASQPTGDDPASPAARQPSQLEQEAAKAYESTIIAARFRAQVNKDIQDICGGMPEEQCSPETRAQFAAMRSQVEEMIRDMGLQ